MKMILPYVNSVSALTTLLEKISNASTPDKLTIEYAKKKLHVGSNTASSCIPFLKRMGFLTSSNDTTELYKKFRGPNKAKAIADGMRIAYRELYEINENLHELPDTELKQLVIQSTGEPKESRVVQLICMTFRMLKNIADFEPHDQHKCLEEKEPPKQEYQKELMHSLYNDLQDKKTENKSFNLSYTINLNLPATDNASIYKAIFQSLKDTLLSE